MFYHTLSFTLFGSKTLNFVISSTSRSRRSGSFRLSSSIRSVSWGFLLVLKRRWEIWRLLRKAVACAILMIDSSPFCRKLSSSKLARKPAMKASKQSVSSLLVLQLAASITSSSCSVHGSRRAERRHEHSLRRPVIRWCQVGEETTKSILQRRRVRSRNKGPVASETTT